MRRFPRTSTPVEMKVVAFLARGDKYADIQSAIEKEFGQTIAPNTITMIKKRNEVALSTIKEAITQREKDDAQGLLDRSHRLIGKKLKAAEAGEEDIKMSDLTAVAKEMFHQARADQLPPDQEKLTNPKQKLKELQELLEENDEIRLERIVFAKRDATSEVLSLPDEPSPEGRDHPGDNVQGPDIQPGSNPDQKETPDQA